MSNCSHSLSKDDIERFSRQLILKGIGTTGMYSWADWFHIFEKMRGEGYSSAVGRSFFTQSNFLTDPKIIMVPLIFFRLKKISKNIRGYAKIFCWKRLFLSQKCAEKYDYCWKIYDVLWKIIIGSIRIFYFFLIKIFRQNHKGGLWFFSIFKNFIRYNYLVPPPAYLLLDDWKYI